MPKRIRKPIPPMRTLLADLRGRERQMLELLGRLVRIESPSFDRAAVERVARLLASEWRRRGARAELLRQRERGPHLRVELGPLGARGQILLLGHTDTVYELGTLRRMPFHIRGGRAYGPGVFDMKAGLVMALFAVDALGRAGIRPQRRIVGLFTSDEEIGSGTSRRILEREARRSDAVLVLEPAQGSGGRLKTARKGVGEAEIEITGRAAHAGINPQDGVNAVHELARQIVRLERLNRPGRGQTVNVDVVEGGTRANVIADRARALVDFRVARIADGVALEKKLRALRPILPGAKLRVRGGMNRPPLERTAAVAALFRLAKELAREMGVTLGEAATGGGSDGNFTGALGIPTLDGLGAVGAGAHTPGEFIIIRSLPERAALLAGLLASL
jgi:glutamate carboxypeptidase